MVTGGMLNEISVNSCHRYDDGINEVMQKSGKLIVSSPTLKVFLHFKNNIFTTERMLLLLTKLAFKLLPDFIQFNIP